MKAELEDVKSRIGTNEQQLQLNSDSLSQLSYVQEAEQVNSQKLLKFERELDEQTNRNLRNTLIIRGLPENKNEKSWDDSIQQFVNHVCPLFGWNEESLIADIEREHRGLKKEDKEVYSDGTPKKTSSPTTT